MRIGKIGLGRQGERIYSVLGVSTTLSSQGGGLGGKTGMYQIDGVVRKLYPRECAIKASNVCSSTSGKWESVKKSPDPIPQILNDPIQFNWKVKEMILKRLCEEKIIGLTTWADIEYIFRLSSKTVFNIAKSAIGDSGGVDF